VNNGITFVFSYSTFLVDEFLVNQVNHNISLLNKEYSAATVFVDEKLFRQKIN